MGGERVEVEVLAEATDETVAAFGRLLPQLSKSAPPLTRADIARILSAEAITLLAARCEGTIAGVLTLVMFPLPTGRRAWIEDVVVDEKFRGRGAGEELTRAAIRIAQAAGARTVDLTSRPEREAAGRLYERTGFTQRDSRVYRYGLQ
jgi:ribosomal protein S18 acetylase RimI-like enzyme